MKLKIKQASGRKLLATFLAVALMMSAFSITAFARSDVAPDTWDGVIVKVDSAYNTISITAEKNSGSGSGNPAWGAGAGVNLATALKSLQAKNYVDSKNEGVSAVPLAIQTSLLSFIKDVKVSYDEDKYNGLGDIVITAGTETVTLSYDTESSSLLATAGGYTVKLGDSDIDAPWMDTVWGKAIGAPIRATVVGLGGKIFYNKVDGSITAYLPRKADLLVTLYKYLAGGARFLNGYSSDGGATWTTDYSVGGVSGKYFDISDSPSAVGNVTGLSGSYKADKVTVDVAQATDIFVVYGDKSPIQTNNAYPTYKGIIRYVTTTGWVYEPLETGGPYTVHYDAAAVNNQLGEGGEFYLVK
ncbi:MAG: hypothetical protein LBM97_00600 [Candidatus Nomurabacteria bacterium]|jgi:hypothetical protein|nr:hypothetical protein [Candidatus Nomurabacteria bacterium]